MYYYVMDFAGRFLTEKGFASYVHYDGIKFINFSHAVACAKSYNAKVEFI